VSIDVLIDTEVLGRQRTGDETYVENLLRRLPDAAPELRFVAVTRFPDRAEGIEALKLVAGYQELRMVSLSRRARDGPRLLIRAAQPLRVFAPRHRRDLQRRQVGEYALYHPR
jgi:D-serine deaminase-like pyridoxal phosphate-dependent protein